MRFLIGLVLGATIGAVLMILATGNAGQALRAQVQEQMREASREASREAGDDSLAE